jgi:hypothetical protein
MSRQKKIGRKDRGAKSNQEISYKKSELPVRDHDFLPKQKNRFSP